MLQFVVLQSELASPSLASDELHDTLGVRVFESRTVPIAPLPPFFSASMYRSYLSGAIPIPGLTFAVRWNVISWPGRGETTWNQAFRDGIELPNGLGIPVAAEIEAPYPSVVSFLYGLKPLHELLPPALVRTGSLGALSSLHYLVNSLDSLRGPTPSNSLMRRLAGQGLFQSDLEVKSSDREAR